MSPALADTLPYRPCVGVMLLNNEGKVWIGNRLAGEGLPAGNHWQMPQGGIDKGELPEHAAFRELHEETGTRNAKIIAEAREWFRYDLPPELIGKGLKGKFRGQEQKWFAMRFTGQDGDIDIMAHEEQEFSEWRWADIDELVDLIVPFKRPVYEQVVAEFRALTLAGA
ncbi:RNA pyrophosphohydrolase [Tepidicaulis sp.]|uniref:RNA pyrophosphohydrolase n=1 Tax=Tepidicaulis sp. TaxID=1920809 RepID=UPI003B5B6D60